MDTLTNKERSPSTGSRARSLSRSLLIAGLAAPLVFYAHNFPTSDAATLVQLPYLEGASAPPPDEIGPLPVALADMNYGLRPADVQSYRRIFAAIGRSDWATVDRLSATVGDRRLIGHIQAQRLLAADVNPSFADLRGWLDRYADFPEADKIYRLADAKRPSDDATYLPRPHAATGPTDADFDPEFSGVAEPKTSAGDHALSKFYSADNKGALTDALHAISALGVRASTSHWIAGLAAWRLGQLEEAGSHFALLARSKTASGWMIAAGAYWAGRVEERHGMATGAAKWFSTASHYPTTFYGMLALRKLGVNIAQKISAQSLTAEHLDRVARTPQGYRAVALLQIGERELAAGEMERIDPDGNPKIEEAIIVLSDAAKLGRHSARLAERIARPTDDNKEKFPIPAWRPHGGFRVDPALLYAVARQESGFDPLAVNPSGAAGLMQIMPATADILVPKRQKSLFDPSTNLDIGQRYLSRLMRDPNIGDNLLLLAVAYNRGSGNPATFRQMLEHDDPLMAVESVSGDETRNFIQHVLTNYWIYRARLGADDSSLDDLAGGRWPLYSWENDTPATATFGLGGN